MFAKLNLAIAALAATAIAQSAIVTGASSSTTASATGTGTAVRPAGSTTISAYIGGVQGASLVSANACSTVLAITCEDSGAGELICDQARSASLTAVTVTAHPYGIDIVESFTTLGVMATFSARCTFQGTAPTYTAEVCTASVSASGRGQQTDGVTTTAVTTPITLSPVLITAGLENLPTSSQSCTSTPGAAMPTAAIEVYKVLVPVGAAVAAGLAVF